MSAKNDSGIGCLILGVPAAIVIAIGIAANVSWTGWAYLWVGALVVVVVVGAIASQFSARQREATERATEQRARAVAMSNVDQMTGVDFERYLQRVLRTRGYAVELTKASNDLGVDLILERDGERVAVQVKRYGTAISRRAISDAVAGMQHYRCSKAMVVTSNYFTRGAKTLATSTSCVLVDRDVLTDWICEYSGRRDEPPPQNRVVLCPRCEQRLRIPEIYKTLRVRCDSCRHEFLYPSR